MPTQTNQTSKPAKTKKEARAKATTKVKTAPKVNIRAVKAEVVKPKVAKTKAVKSKVVKPKVADSKAVKPKVKTVKPLTPKQLQEQRSQAARRAALARWSKERPLSQKAIKQQLSRVPSSELTVEHYADRPNPELSWAAAILKRQQSGEEQRRKAAEIMSRVGVPKSSGKLAAYLNSLTPEQRHEIAQRAGRRRWEIWREKRAHLEGRKRPSKNK